jgi:hypothetical protein
MCDDEGGLNGRALCCIFSLITCFSSSPSGLLGFVGPGTLLGYWPAEFSLTYSAGWPLRFQLRLEPVEPGPH